jgi:methylenetetrahydrofolate dehydrogenase (NADP+)/methenyltetrahydrofolate cyclohydrolase
MQKLSAKVVTAALEAQLRPRIARVTAQRGSPPKLVVILVGQDPASQIYVQKKGEAAALLGIQSETLRLTESATPAQVQAEVDRLNQDPSVDGILIQRPLPKTFREEEVLYWVNPSKDVDAFHPENTGRLVLGLPCFRPCTPAGVMALLDHYGISPAGKVACVVGRSSIVGKPMAALLLQKDATVIQAHSRTPALEKLTQQADLLVVAAGKPGLIQQHHIKPGAVVIDVGIHRTAQGTVVGDCDFDSVSRVAGAMTPVPGGVGPMTIAILMQNTVWSAERRLGLS